MVDWNESWKVNTKNIAGKRRHEGKLKELNSVSFSNDISGYKGENTSIYCILEGWNSVPAGGRE